MFLRGFFRRTTTIFEMHASVAFVAPTFPHAVNALASEEAVVTGLRKEKSIKSDKIR